VFQAVLLLLMLFMRKRVSLTIALFHVAGKVFLSLPLLTLLPFVTFLALLLFWVYWILVLLFLGTSGQFTPSFVLWPLTRTRSLDLYSGPVVWTMWSGPCSLDLVVRTL